MKEGIRFKVCGTSEEWRAERLRTVGGSSAAVAIGKGRWKTKEELWDEMHAVIVGGTPPKERGSDDMRRGSVFEPVAIALLAETLGVSINRHDQLTIVRNSKTPWAHCTPDGWIGDQIVEVKVPRPGTIAKCNMEGLLEAWAIQAQHNMEVCMSPVCHVGLLDPMSATLHYFKVERDEPFIFELMKQEAHFVASIIKEIRPEQTPVVVDEFSESAEVTLEEPGAIEMAKTWFRLKQAKDDAEQALEEVKRRLVQMSGDAHIFTVAGVGKFRHKPNKGSRTLNKDAILSAYPDIAGTDRFWKTSKPSRPFIGREMW